MNDMAGQDASASDYSVILPCALSRCHAPYVIVVPTTISCVLYE